MALDDWTGEVVLRGTWLYDGEVQQPVFIVARNFDHYFDPDDEDNEPGTVPMPLGPDGYLYALSFERASAGGPWQTIDEAKAWANSQPWGPVRWEDES